MRPEAFPSLPELGVFVSKQLNLVTGAALQIEFSREKRSSATKSIIEEIPAFAELSTGYGLARWATVLFVDLRSSTDRAVKIGPKDTYISMHCLLATLAHLVNCAGGYIGNFRGDGLFGLFGLDGEGENSPNTDVGEAVERAVRCGKAMIEGVDQVLRPSLKRKAIDDDLRIGVGIDYGDVVVTRIGLSEHANELTVYGPSVNSAAKCCGGNGQIILTERSKRAFPSSKGGKVTFDPVHFRNAKIGDAPKGYCPVYPNGSKVLGDS